MQTLSLLRQVQTLFDDVLTCFPPVMYFYYTFIISPYLFPISTYPLITFLLQSLLVPFPFSLMNTLVCKPKAKSSHSPHGVLSTHTFLPSFSPTINQDTCWPSRANCKSQLLLVSRLPMRVLKKDNGNIQKLKCNLR